MAAASGFRVSPILFGGGFIAVAALVTILSISILTGSLSAGLLLQLAFGGEMPARALVGAVSMFVGFTFVLLGVLLLFSFAS